MANPTAQVPSAIARWGDDKIKRPLVSTQQNYYKFEAIGMNTSGYATKFDDAASLMFLGLAAEAWEQPSGASNGTYSLTTEHPYRFLLKMASVAITDVGRIVYALYSNEGTLNPASTTYANVYGVVDEYVDSTHAWIRPVTAAEAKVLGATRVMAATGAQTITKFDVWKKINVPNTATLTLTLPAVADVGRGAELEFLKNHASDTNAITLDGADSENIDGATTLATLDAPYDCARLVCDGTRWIVASRDIA